LNALQKTLAIIALLALVSQSVRHAYRLWLEPRGSALDKYDQPLKDTIENAGSLEELLGRYDKARKEVDEKRQQRKEAEQPERVQLYSAELTEPYKSERALREAITDWEKKDAEIHELRFYWMVGLALLILGIVSYRKLSRWFGLTLLIAGFSEFIYWTSPTFFGPGTREYNRLLANKLVFSVASLILLLAVIWIKGIFANEKEQTKL
jgi:hypothetical protein